MTDPTSLKIVTPVLKDGVTNMSNPNTNTKARSLAALGEDVNLHTPLTPMLKERHLSIPTDADHPKPGVIRPHITPHPNPNPSPNPNPRPRPIVVTPPITALGSATSPPDRELKISLPSLAEIYTCIRVEIHTKVLETLSCIMDRMGDDYGIDPEELKERYLADLRVVLEQDKQQSKRVSSANAASKRAKNPVDPNIRCMARTAGGEQCTRRRQVQNDLEYCGSHSMSQPYGRIDEDAPVVEKRKRGRPRKIDSPYANETVELNFEIVYEGGDEDGDGIDEDGLGGEGTGSTSRKEYIRDQNNNVYEKPTTETIGSLGELTRIGTYDPVTKSIIRVSGSS